VGERLFGAVFISLLSKGAKLKEQNYFKKLYGSHQVSEKHF
jgi:hypothetical protein